MPHRHWFWNRKKIEKFYPKVNIATLLICHTRQEHLRKVLSAIENSDRPTRSPLVIYLQDSPLEVLSIIKNYTIENKFVVTSDGLFFKTTQQAINHNIYNGLKFAFDEFEIDACIVLEDDIVIAPDFYSFFIGILDLFRISKNFRGVNGFSIEKNPSEGNGSYVRVNYGLGWGWAITRDTFQSVSKYWNGSENQHWDFILEPYLRTGFVVNPIRSRILNIGFDESATHTKSDSQLGFKILESYQSLSTFQTNQLKETESQFLWRQDCIRISQRTKLVENLIYLIGWISYGLQRIELISNKFPEYPRIVLKRNLIKLLRS